ncbi:hypothetical protein EX895_006223 [Sporisorium graminicola]|uniref:Methyltransferase domain-containing protein n=1 Tax=Sporisorium graminicola TaxID=280036 RepID=A0A4U7KM74_9BASI|nr:hypothetical protein EX895_006223 [Sporisorium graminicola]TKY85143.1 hypothetical protein EX895_006223 [Sporisorium graminicola]
MGSRKSSARQASESRAAPKQSDSAPAAVSKSSSVDSRSQQSSYMGGDGLSPASTISNDQATKSSLAASSPISSTNNITAAAAAAAPSLPHKLPEFDHFRQSSPLMPEFYPRTSDFFSQGRRRSSIAVSPESAISPGSAAAGAPPAFLDRSANGGINSTKKSDTFNLPLTFEETESLEGEQLPVRLGLAPPSHSHGLPPSEMTYKARVGHGYYFYTPPPPQLQQPASRQVPASKASAVPSLRRRDTDMSEASSLSLNTKPTPAPSLSSPSSISPGAASSSPYRASASSSISSLPTSTHAGHAGSSKHLPTSSARPRLPPSSPDCWHPDAYFSKSRSRVKGKMREFVYHSFPHSVVPYWHGYNSETTEAEMATHLNVKASLHGNTLRDFPEGSRPCRVLDLGCGRGFWCLDMAREWKTSEFVGLDIVPIQPPMASLADPDLEHRVSWVVANFLEPLPFPDASFDYVHIRYILQGVPEDKWFDLLSECRRILAPGGVLELVEGNYGFYGHPSWVDSQELKDLEHGRVGARKGFGVKLPKRLKVLNDSDSTDVDAIEVVFERMMHRRFINPTPLSVVPSALLLPGFSTVANGNPRHIPIYAESSAQRARARAAAAVAAGEEPGSSSANATSSEDEGKRQGRFTSRGQIGNPLNSQFQMTDRDFFSAFALIQHLGHFSSSRELVWAEAEEEKRSLQGQPQPELSKMDSNRRFGQGNPTALKPFAHPWKSKDAFFRALDAWIEATKASADTEHLLRKYLGWEQAHEDLTVEGRKYAERRRKMSTSSAAIPALGLDQLVLDDAGENKAGMREARGRLDSLAATAQGLHIASVSPSSASAFAVSTTHAHEAPARLQTTRASAPDTRAVSHADESNSNSKTAAATATTALDGGKKKKKSTRPSSSGNAGSSSPGSFGTTASARTRPFGRGGAAGGALTTKPLPLPDAPAFMAGYAFTSSPATEPASMFRGPATKASIVASSRGGGAVVGARKASGSNKSVSDRSSLSSSKTEGARPAKEGAAKEGVPPTAGSKAAAAGTGGAEVSPAAAYAATQRVSHGLEDETRLNSAGASRPVSPTSAVVTSSTAPTAPPAAHEGVPALGARPPPTPGAAAAADSRSVSMPTTLSPPPAAAAGGGAGAGSVRIAEPPTRPSKLRSRSKSNAAAAATALMGFYDTTGFIAIA